MYPLQSLNLSDFQTKNTTINSAAAQIFAIGVGIVVIVLVILNVYKSKFQSKSGGKQKTAAGPRQFSAFTLHRITNDLGLDREQVKMLDYVMKSGGVSDPERFLNSPNAVDKSFKHAYRIIERTSENDEELNERLAILFSTRNIIDANVKGSASSSSSAQKIPEKASAVLTVEKTNYSVQVISSRGDMVVVENPKKTAGGNVHLPHGSKATLAFFTSPTKGFSVETRVMGTQEGPHGPVLQLAHSGKMKKLSSRRFRRRETIIATAFYLVNVDPASKKMTVDKRKCTGNIQDISVGGCSLKTGVPVSVGQRLKIEFTHDDNSMVAALGEVLRINRSGMSTILHIKFLKVPRKSLNSINAMVYEYDEI
jgi:hypothetical protein